MKKSLALACAVLCIAGMAILAGCPQPDTTDPNNYSISGTVTVGAGADVTQAVVELLRNDVRVGDTIKPDTNGKFSFPNVSQGDGYIVKVTIDNYDSWKSNSISVPNARSLAATLSKQKFAITGTVNSTYSGADITKAKLVLVRAGEGDDVDETTPAEDGKYAFSNLSAGAYFIRANLALHEAFFGQEDIDVTAADASGEDITLKREFPMLKKATLDGDKLFLVWSDSVTITSKDGFTLETDDPSGIGISDIAATPDTDGAEWTFSLSRPAGAAEKISLAYDSGTGNAAHTQDSAPAVSFPKTVIPPPFGIVSAELSGEGQSTRLTLKFNARVNIATIGGSDSNKLSDGMELYYDTVAYSGINMAMTQSDSDTISFVLMGVMRGVSSKTVFTLSYNDGQTKSGKIKASDGTPLPAFSKIPVTNLIPPEYDVTGKVTANVAGANLTTAKVYLYQGATKIDEKSPAADGSYTLSGAKTGTGYVVKAIMNLYGDVDSATFSIDKTDVNLPNLDLVRVLPALKSAVVKDNTLFLEWTQSVSITDADGFTLTTDNLAGLDFDDGTAAVVPNTDSREWKFTLNNTPDAADAITLDYDNTSGNVAHKDGTKPLSFNGVAVPVKIAPPFGLASAEIGKTGNNIILTLKFNAALDEKTVSRIPEMDGLPIGLELRCNNTVFNSGMSQVTSVVGDTVVIWTIGLTVDGTTDFKLSYADGGIKDSAGTLLPNFSDFAVTNKL